MKRGFTLFEILLVLFVMSMIVIGGIQYANRKAEETSAKQLGHKLYQYGIAVAEYTRINPDGHTDDYEAYGIEWLKNTINPETCTDPNNPATCEMFLGKDFNLKLQALYIGDLHGDADDEDDKIYTKFIQDPITGNFNLDFIELGTLYRYSKDDKKYTVDLSLPGRAAVFANEFIDEYGGARIIYTVQEFTGNNNVDDIHIIGLVNTSGPNVDAGFLRTDGSNQMDADVQFSASGKGLIFGNGDGINSLRVEGSTATVDKAFPPQNRTNDGSSQNNIPEFTGSDFQLNRRNSGNAWIRLARGNTVYTEKNSFCMLTGMETVSTNSVCRVTPTTESHGGIQAGDWVLFLRLHNDASNQAGCFARCVLFKQ